MDRVKDLRKKGCNCAIKTTHGLPCACELKRFCDRGEAVPVGRIHPFWRILVINEKIVDIPAWSDYPSKDHKTFQSLAEEVNASNVQTIRNVNMAIQRVLHPESASYCEPQIKDKSKGRPKGSTSTARLPSAWEYIKSQISRKSTSLSRKATEGRKSCSFVIGKNHSTKYSLHFHYNVYYVSRNLFSFCRAVCDST